MRSSAWVRSNRCCRTPPYPISGHHPQAGLYRANGKLHRTPVEFKDDQHLLRIIEEVVSRVGQARRRIFAHGGRAAARWLPRQRSYPAGGGGRAAALHPPFRPRSAQAEDLVRS